MQCLFVNHDISLPLIMVNTSYTQTKKNFSLTILIFVREITEMPLISISLRIWDLFMFVIPFLSGSIKLYKSLNFSQGFLFIQKAKYCKYCLLASKLPQCDIFIFLLSFMKKVQHIVFTKCWKFVNKFHFFSRIDQISTFSKMKRKVCLKLNYFSN